MSIPLQRFKQERALSSAGSEHLPYKQRVGGSNPSAPTTHLSTANFNQRAKRSRATVKPPFFYTLI